MSTAAATLLLPSCITFPCFLLWDSFESGQAAHSPGAATTVPEAPTE